LCDATNLHPRPVTEATPKSVMIEEDLDNYSPMEPFILDRGVIISINKMANNQGQVRHGTFRNLVARAIKRRAGAHPSFGSLVLGQNSKKFSLIQALAITYTTSTRVSHIMVYTRQDLFTVAAVTDFSFKWVEILQKVQTDKSVNQIELGEPPPCIGV
jgi:hypothetical protein